VWIAEEAAVTSRPEKLSEKWLGGCRIELFDAAKGQNRPSSPRFADQRDLRVRSLSGIFGQFLTAI